MRDSNLNMIIALGLMAIVFVSGCTSQPRVEDDQSKLMQFKSEEEIADFLERNSEGGSYYGMFDMAVGAPTMAREDGDLAAGATSEASALGSNEAKSSTDDYSTTNIQVEGVDEADIVKNDGKYIYVLTGKKIVIVDAYPAEEAKIVWEQEINNSISDIFVNDDKLVVFGSKYITQTDTSVVSCGEGQERIDCIVPPLYDKYGTFIKVFDMTDRSNPIEEREFTISGNYYSSRMIGDYVYAIVNENVYRYGGGPVPMPLIMEGGNERSIAASEIFYFDVPDYGYQYTNIIALNVKDANEDATTETYLMGYSNNLFVSIDSIYMVYTKNYRMTDFYMRILEDAVMPVLPVNVRNEVAAVMNDEDLDEYEKMRDAGDIIQEHIESLNPKQGADLMKAIEQRTEAVQIEISKEMEKSIIHKISIDKSKIEYKTSGEVPGHTLNQFSMDEHNGYLRVATTTGNWRATSLNHLYILDGNLDIVGKVEDLAKGERIYSARFMGDRAYMVTFRQIDPLFVIDVSNPTNPQVLGYLKIPGVSEYLHPYDENHIIGFGHDASEEGRMQGLKLSLFDVSDVSNPVEKAKYVWGTRSTSSEAMYDHHAFLFDREKGLLVVPVSDWSSDRIYSDSFGRYIWKSNYWQGAFVFDVGLDTGFEYKGNVTHMSFANETEEEEYYWPSYDYQAQVRRSLYMDDVLYTISNRYVKMNGLDDLEEINSVELPYVDPYRDWVYYGGVGMAEDAVGMAVTITEEA